MRRQALSSPRPTPSAPAEPAGPPSRGAPGGRIAPETLAAPTPARPRLRKMFDPVGGWVRRMERGLSRFLAAHVYPWLPGISVPYGVQLRRRLTVFEADVPVAGLHPDLVGTRLLLLTDVHVGPFLRPGDLRAVFERLLRLQPDLVVLGGDLVTARLGELPLFAPAFRVLNAPLGVWAVLGNHDHYTGRPEDVRRLGAEAGLRFLHNDAALVRRGNGKIALAGIDDWNLGRPDLEGALRSARELDDQAPVILVSHNPDVFFDAVRAGSTLVLSGHTHGGQIRIPGLPVLVRMSRYRLDEGRYRWNGAELVVSRGLGATGLPLRIACPPEAVLLHLL